MSLYSLTHLTGRKRNADRTIVIATVETSKQGFIISVIAILASALPTAIATVTFGPVAMIVVPALFVAAALVLFRARATKGLQLPIYRMLLDKTAARRARGQILVCGVPIQGEATLGRFVQSSVPAIELDAAPATRSKRATGKVSPVHGAAPKYHQTPAPTDLWK